MARVAMRSLDKKYDEVHAVKDINLEIRDGEFVVLVGPSGCGKTTILRMIAGLEEHHRGHMYIDDDVVNKLAPNDRDIAMVFQNYALYPHMTVYDNMAFGLKLRKFPRPRSSSACTRRRRCSALRQLPEAQAAPSFRAASASASPRPRDRARPEGVPVRRAALEPRRQAARADARRDCRSCTSGSAPPMVYVTHDQVEAMTMGDRIVVMQRRASSSRSATPMELYNHPANRFVAGFIGSPAMNFVDRPHRRGNGGLWADQRGHSRQDAGAS